jgi:quinol monooxygenase YgiN
MNLKKIGKQFAMVVVASVLAAGCCTTCDSAKCCAKAEKDPIYVLCRFDLKQGKADEYVKAVNEITAAVRAEKGCRFYFLAGDAETSMKNQQCFGKDVLWMIECWDDEESLKAHLQAPHMKVFGPKARTLRHSNTFHILKEYK